MNQTPHPLPGDQASLDKFAELHLIPGICQLSRKAMANRVTLIAWYLQRTPDHCLWHLLAIYHSLGWIDPGEIYSSHLASVCTGKSLWDVWFSKPSWVTKLFIQAKLNVRCDHRELRSKPAPHVWSWLFPSCLSLVLTSSGTWTWRKC